MNMVEPQDPNRTFSAFVVAHGPEVIARAYRRPLLHVAGERHWDFYDHDVLIGWGSIMRLPSEGYSYRAGVFPAFERRGYRGRIRRLLAYRAFQDPECRVLVTSALLSNPAQVVRLVREAADGEWAPVSGAVFAPPARLIFTMTREFFKTRIERPEDKG